MLLKFHWLGLMFSMILLVSIIILTSGSSGASSMAAPYVLKDFIDFDLNLYFKQFWWNFICWAYVFNDLFLVLIIILTLDNFGEVSVAAPYVMKDFIDFD